MKDKKTAYLDESSQAEAFVPPHGLSASEKSEADLELKRLRLLRLGQMSEKQRLYGALLQLKYQMEDYLRLGAYEPQYSFGAFLKMYLDILGRKQKDFAVEIDLHPSKLNQMLADKANMNVAMAYRLEKHSGGLLLATDWWKLHAKKIEASIVSDKKTRLQEEKKVMQAVVF